MNSKRRGDSINDKNLFVKQPRQTITSTNIKVEDTPEFEYELDSIYIKNDIFISENAPRENVLFDNMTENSDKNDIEIKTEPDSNSSGFTEMPSENYNANTNVLIDDIKIEENLIKIEESTDSPKPTIGCGKNIQHYITNTNSLNRYRSPRKHINTPKRITGIDDADKAILKREILNFHVTERTVPTLKSILPKFKDVSGFNGGRESLRKIVQGIGFRWRKTQSNRKVLMERQEIRFQRTNYLRDIRRFRQEGRPIVYMDETYIHASHTTVKSWNENTSSEGLKEPIGKGQRMIIVNAGNENGFIPNATLIFQSSTKTGDYHSEMNFVNYAKWLQEKLIPNLPPRTVLVIDNAPYHNVQKDKCPTTASTKQEIKDWLQRKGIPFEDTLLKSELYRLVLLNKPTYKTYVIDDILLQHQHTVLRLPPYLPDLNPIELVWASLKEYVAKNNVRFRLAHVKELCEEFFRDFPVVEWAKRCAHARKCEEEFLEREGNIDAVVDEFIINLGDDSSGHSSSDDSDEFSSDCE